MKKLISLFLILTMLFGYASCSGSNGNDDNTPDVPNSDSNESENGTNNTLTIVVPEYKDYQRGTVNFDKLIYSRPNMQSIIDAFLAASEAVKANLVSAEAQIAMIRELEGPLMDVETMYSLSQIYNNKDSSVEYWQTEYGYISANYPKLSQAIEDLLVACARSDHKTVFENDYFGYSLDEYVDGGIYSDAVVALMAEEARLESEYTSISTATVEITYNGVSSEMQWSGTVDEVIVKAREYFKDDDASYDRCLLAIDLLYQQAREKIEEPIFIDLIRIRRLIADELGYSSYSQLAYDSMGYDYTPEEMQELLYDIGQYSAPVASDLEYTVFQSYFQTNVQPKVNTITVINKLYDVYSGLGGDYKDAYSYMLQHGLYDVAADSRNRYPGAFTTYVENNNSPYLFMTASGFIRDYTTLAHEFGHFLDSYVNDGADESLAISEISSQALELLTITRLKNFIGQKNYSYLEYYTLFTFLNSVLLTQSFYAAFEHMVYDLEYDEITSARLSMTVENAFSLIFGENITIDGDLSYVAITHTFLYPFYVESYVTSGIVSLDIFFSESSKTGSRGDGFKLYETLINRGNSELGFTERLSLAGLDSPFDHGKVKEISDNIYFQILGKHYYQSSNNDIGAA